MAGILDEIIDEINTSGNMTVPPALVARTRSNSIITKDDMRYMMSTIVSFKELMMMYSCAIKEIRTKFEVLDTDLSLRNSRNPIQSISTRLKRSTSIIQKLERKGLEPTVENIERNINDMAGIRVICAYIDDIYFLADALVNQDDITLITRKDYIQDPKPNGYRSLHLIVSVPVFFSDKTREMKVEVQIRTIAMDFWASLEHQLKYKNNSAEPAEIVSELTECASGIAELDKRMLGIRQRIDSYRPDSTPEDDLLEKLMRIDLPL